MKEFAAIVWNFAFTCLSLTHVVTASHNKEVKHIEGRLFSTETKQRSSGSKEERNTQYLNDAAGPATGLSLNIPRNLSLYPRPRTNSFGITSLSWDDRSESEEHAAVHENGHEDGLNTSPELSQGGKYSSTGGSMPGTLDREYLGDTNTGTTTNSSGGATSLPSAPQISKRTPVFELEVAKSGSGPESSFLRPLSSTSESNLSSSSSNGTEKPYNSADWYSQQAEAFIASLDPAVNPSGSTRAVSGLSGLAKHTYVDTTQCMMAVLFGLAKQEGDAQSVHGVDEVTVNNASQCIKVVYRVKKGSRDSSFWETQHARLRKAVGVYKQKQEVLSVQLPQGCVANSESRYFLFSTGRESRKSRALVLDSVVLSLGFAVDAFRVPRTSRPKPVAVPVAMLPNRWTPEKCSWFLKFHRTLTEPPLLKIDSEKGLMMFQNKELQDLQMSFLEYNRQSGSGSCDWSSALFSKVHVIVDTKETPPVWQLQLDLAERTDVLIWEHKVKVNSSVTLGLPTDLTGRGIRVREGAS